MGIYKGIIILEFLGCEMDFATIHSITRGFGLFASGRGGGGGGERNGGLPREAIISFVRRASRLTDRATPARSGRVDPWFPHPVQLRVLKG